VSREFTCLAVETATDVCSIAACVGERSSVRDYATADKMSRHIYEVVHEVLDEIGLNIGSLDCLAFGSGPGGFTGLRVGAAVVQALAFGGSKPACCISSLAALAAGAMRKYDVARVAPCFDARMGEVYIALYQVNENGVMNAEVVDCLANPDDYDFDSVQPFFAAGPGWNACPNLLERHADRILHRDLELRPSAQDLLLPARRLYESGQTIPAAEVLPNYIRDKVTG
jgi:tRNA threonylcarbamoyladenosine biosynthesis protein TsaB